MVYLKSIFGILNNYFNIIYREDDFMNGSYYNQSYNDGMIDNGIYKKQAIPMYKNQYSNEYTYISDVLRLNKGKKVKLHVTIPNSTDWRDRIFDGIIEYAGGDYVILSNPSTGEWNLIMMIYLDFIIFEESINYSPQFYN